MSIVVTKSSPVVVCPSKQAPSTEDIDLSAFDKVIRSRPVSLLLVFDKPIVDPVETIRRALSGALVHYYHISGRLADGSEVIRCTGGEGQGVLFMGASASCTIDDMLFMGASASRCVDDVALLNNLSIHYPEEFLCRPADPLLLMQVTVFSCGGFVVGVTWNHVLADGAGIEQFLQAVGELSRGKSLLSIVPVRRDDLVLAAHPQGMTAMDFASAELTMDLAYLDFTIPSRIISRIKAEVGKTCTVFEAVVALLWQCRARAVICEEDDPATLSFTSDMRGLVKPAGGYYGNCCIAECIHAKCGQVANSDLKDVVDLIKTAKRKIQEQFKTKADGVENSVQKQQQQQLGYNTLLVSSWRNLGLEAPDFGSGRPARVIWYMSQRFIPNFILCPPCKGKHEDVNVVGYIVKKEHIDAFMREVDRRCIM